MNNMASRRWRIRNSTMQQTITHTLTQKHSDCDKLFAELEANVPSQQWNVISDELNTFIFEMEKHFSGEEQILFPSFEEQTGHTMGPTQVMRMEHIQMRQIFSTLKAMLEQQDSNELLGHLETLLMLMRQHNAKEEQILYPMIDQMLHDQIPDLLDKMEKTS